MKGRKFIDFNGVILDTESRMIELKRQYPGLTGMNLQIHWIGIFYFEHHQ